VQAEATEETGVEVQKLKEVVQALDGERDKIQNELDEKCEAMRRLEAGAADKEMELHSAKIELQNAQIKVREVEQAFREREGEHEAILRQCKQLHAENTALQSDGQSAQQEINALSEDMTQMAREQQVVNADLVKAVSQRNALQDEVRVLRPRAAEAGR